MFYYPPLPFYVVAFFNLITRNVLLSLELGCAVATVLSGVTMYAFISKLASPPASLVAAVLYMVAPYHVLELCRIAALSEFWSFVWIPLILDALRRIALTRSWRDAGYLALWYALLIFTHVPASRMVTLAIPLYLLLLTRDKAALLRAAAGIGLGLGLSAIFLVSVVFETKYVHIDRLLEKGYENKLMFENLSGLSLTNIFSVSDYPHPSGYVKAANLAAVGIALLLIPTLSVLWVQRKTIRLNASSLPAAACGVALASLLMTTRLTEPLWSRVRFLQYLQTPIRWLVPATAATVVIVAIAISAVANKRGRSVVWLLLICVAVAFNLVVSAHFATQSTTDAARLQEALTEADVVESTTIWWDGKFHEEMETSAALVVDGEAQVVAMDDAGLKQSYQVSAATPATIKFRSGYFP